MRSATRPALLALLLAAPGPAAEPAGLVQEPLFVAGRDGYHTYRIPSLLVTGRGTLLAFCEGRKTGRADHGDLDLVLRRSTDGGKTWGRQQVVHEEGGTARITIGNPCPVLDASTGVVWLPFTRDNDDVLVTSSSDDGQTWARPTRITAQVKKPTWGWYATGPGVGIQLRQGPHRGRLVIPCDHRIKGEKSSSSHCIFSDDHGKTWQLGEAVAPYTNECQVVERADGSLLINMRNNWGRDGGRKDRAGVRATAVSTDGGKTWGELGFARALPEPVCQASLVRHTWPDGEGAGRILFSNPASASGRHHLTVRLSTDDGATWPAARLLHEGPAAYSCLAALPDGSVACLYERGTKDPYETITFARFPLAWLSDGKER